MGKPLTLLERLCIHVLQFDSHSITVERKEGQEWVYAEIDGAQSHIAHFKDKSSDAEELRTNLAAVVKKPLRIATGGQAYVIEARNSDSPEKYDVGIQPAPKLDPWAAPKFTAKQGQYLAFIHSYIKIHRQSPAETDLERYFRVSPPAIHDMIMTLQRKGFIERTPGQGRSIRLLVNPEHLPPL